MLSNCIQALLITRSSRGDGHLEQPTTAMSWSEPCVQQWILTASGCCINLPACAYGADLRKAWMRASSLNSLTDLGGLCEHGPQAHQQISGIRDSSGAFISRSTAEYPLQLAASFAEVVSHVLSHSHQGLSVEETHRPSPIKGLRDAPFSRQDGGGMPSLVDWSSPPRDMEDTFQFP